MGRGLREHDYIGQGTISTDRADTPTLKLKWAHHCIGIFARCKSLAMKSLARTERTLAIIFWMLVIESAAGFLPSL